MKVIINNDYGGFSLSDEAIESYAERKGITLRKEERQGSVLSADYYLEDGNEWFNCRDIPRNDPTLVAVVEKLGKEADGFCANLKVIEIPEDVNWQVEENDGLEWISEKHRTWM